MTLLRRSPMGCVGIGLLAVLIFLAVFGPVLIAHDPIKPSLLFKTKPPMWRNATGDFHPLGTDHLGRDVFARLVHGLRISLFIGLVAAVGAGLVGSILGLSAGYFGGMFDKVVMRFSDIQLSFPFILLAILWVAVFGSGIHNIVIIIAIRGWVDYARVVRGVTLTLRQGVFVESARALGASSWRIVVRHLFPQVIPQVLVLASFQVGAAVVLESTLGFLGLGVPPPLPTLGRMLSEARAYSITAPWLVAAPGLAIMAVVLSANMVGDGLREVFDPKMRGR